MPSKNPRLNLTLEPELYGLIDELATLRGVSRASIVVDMLDAAEPTLRRLLSTLRTFIAAQEQSRDRFVANLEEAEQTLAPVVSAALDQLDLAMNGDGQPPHSNTGVTPNPESIPSRRAYTTKSSYHNVLRVNSARESSRRKDGGSE